ncbi:hypothetical protein B0H17DRAFT_1133531 [Mycena rosella]|uniref:Uncharacterized protein n=1 Tax=Mycena rosella TaxID=1033263 RepID=A0AAD7DHU4_MYCRO|nr:hypothetical protein B0H17DRAFT_1133531 [Mycena rosella]
MTVWVKDRLNGWYHTPHCRNPISSSMDTMTMCSPATQFFSRAPTTPANNRMYGSSETGPITSLDIDTPKYGVATHAGGKRRRNSHCINQASANIDENIPPTPSNSSLKSEAISTASAPEQEICQKKSWHGHERVDVMLLSIGTGSEETTQTINFTRCTSVSKCSTVETRTPILPAVIRTSTAMFVTYGIQRPVEHIVQLDDMVLHLVGEYPGGQAPAGFSEACKLYSLERVPVIGHYPSIANARFTMDVVTALTWSANSTAAA